MRPTRGLHLFCAGEFLVAGVGAAHGLDEVLAHFPDGAGEFAEVGDDLVERGDEAVGFLLADDERGEELDDVAGESPITTGKPGHDTPPGHYTILVKDIDHKSNLYGVFLDANGYVIDGNAEAGQKPPPGAVYDSADMPYYLRIRDDGVGLHAGYLPGYPASHGCIRLPHAFAELLFSNISVGTPVDVVP